MLVVDKAQRIVMAMYHVVRGGLGFREWIRAIFPIRCAHCQEVFAGDVGLCEGCRHVFVINNDSERCLRCDLATGRGCLCRQGRYHLDARRGFVMYRGAGKSLLLEIKKRHHTALIPEILERALSDPWLVTMMERVDIVTFIPQAYAVRCRRGYNIASIFAYGLARRFSMRHKYRHLLRTVVVQGQKNKSRAERYAAYKHRFRCIEEGHGKSILVVDDLSTTGATLESAARCLKYAGYSEVLGWAAFLREKVYA